MRLPTAIRRACLVVAALGLVVSTGACRADVAIDVDVNSDGSGMLTTTLTLDSEAVKALRGTVEERLEVDDLREAGWSVVIAGVKSGGARVTARRSFAGPVQLATLVRELSGAQGPLREVSLERDRSILRGRYRFKAEVDLRAAETGIGGDTQLAATLRSAGIDQAQLEELFRSRMADGMTMSVGVDLPGSGGAERVAKPGKLTELSASSTTWAYDRIALLALAALLLVVVLLALLVPAGSHRELRGRR